MAVLILLFGFGCDGLRWLDGSRENTLMNIGIPLFFLVIGTYIIGSKKRDFLIVTEGSKKKKDGREGKEGQKRGVWVTCIDYYILP